MKGTRPYSLAWDPVLISHRYDMHIHDIQPETVTQSRHLNGETRHLQMQELKVDAAQQLRTGMWRFRSGLSNKQLLDPGPDRVMDAGEKTLREFWEVAIPHIEEWSEAFLEKRFHFP